MMPGNASLPKTLPVDESNATIEPSSAQYLGLLYHCTKERRCISQVGRIHLNHLLNLDSTLHCRLMHQDNKNPPDEKEDRGSIINDWGGATSAFKIIISNGTRVCFFPF